MEDRFPDLDFIRRALHFVRNHMGGNGERSALFFVVVVEREGNQDVFRFKMVNKLKRQY